MKMLWCLKTDDSGHWYLISVLDSNLFDKLLTEALENDSGEFDEKFWKNRMPGGPTHIKFENPSDFRQESGGEK